DGEKIWRVLEAAPLDRVAELVHELPAADRRLHAHGLAGEVADKSDLVEQLIDIGDIAVTVAAYRSLARREPVGFWDSLGYAPRRDKSRTAGSELAPKLMPLMFTTDLPRNGSLQKSSPIASGGVGRRSSSSTG